MNRFLLVTTSLVAAGLVTFGAMNAHGSTPSVEVNFRALDELQRGYTPAPADVYIPRPQVATQIPVQIPVSPQLQASEPVQPAPQMVGEMPINSDSTVHIPVQIPADNNMQSAPNSVQIQPPVKVENMPQQAPQYDTVQIPVQIPFDGGASQSIPPVVSAAPDAPLPSVQLPPVERSERYIPSGQLRWVKGPEGKQRLELDSELKEGAKLPPADLPSEEGMDLASMKRKPKLQSDAPVDAVEPDKAEPKVRRAPAKNKNVEVKAEKVETKSPHLAESQAKLSEVKIPEIKAPEKPAKAEAKPVPEKNIADKKSVEKIEKPEVVKLEKKVEAPLPVAAMPKLPELPAVAEKDSLPSLPDLPMPQQPSQPDKEQVKSVVGKNDGKQVTGESSFKDKLMARIKGDADEDKKVNSEPAKPASEVTKMIAKPEAIIPDAPNLPEIPSLPSANIKSDAVKPSPDKHHEKAELPPLPPLPAVSAKHSVPDVKAPELPKLPESKSSSELASASPALPELPKIVAEQKLDVPALPKNDAAKPSGDAGNSVNVLSKLPSLGLQKADKVSDEEKLVGAEAKLAGLSAATKQGDKIFSIKFLETETELPLSSTDNLKGVIVKMNNAPNTRFNIAAYASGNKEQAADARRISLSRALAVKKFLENNGVKKESINVQAMGNRSESGSDSDRVDVYIDK